MTDKRTFDQKTSHYYKNQANNLQTRDELVKRGVKKTTPNLPQADYTFEGAFKAVKAMDKRTTARRK